METLAHPSPITKLETPAPILRDLAPELGREPFTAHELPSHTTDHPTLPAHTQTKSSLAPTSEFVRYLLLALPARYTMRGTVMALFGDKAPPKIQGAMDRLTNRIWGADAHKTDKRDFTKEVAYDYALGVGSLTLTTTYTSLVYKDILNLFRESVGMELEMKPEDVTFWDLKRSHNPIVTKTLSNFNARTAERYLTDALFFTRPIKKLQWLPIGDLAIGIKTALAFIDTWNRKPTMFEDLLTFVHNKINPSNGLGQPINIGEVFDLYQHYAQAYAPDRAFRGVIEHASGEGARWVENQAIFQRLTDLMNKTYAYKHSSIVDPTTGRTVNQADFALPKFIYLLGHDLIDINKPEQTLVTIEIANRHGIGAVKEMDVMLKQEKSLDEVMTRYQVTLPQPHTQTPVETPNELVTKGSFLERAAPESTRPATQITASSVRDVHPLAKTAQQATLA